MPVARGRGSDRTRVAQVRTPVAKERVETQLLGNRRELGPTLLCDN